MPFVKFEPPAIGSRCHSWNDQVSPACTETGGESGMELVSIVALIAPCEPELCSVDRKNFTASTGLKRRPSQAASSQSASLR